MVSPPGSPRLLPPARHCRICSSVEAHGLMNPGAFAHLTSQDFLNSAGCPRCTIRFSRLLRWGGLHAGQVALVETRRLLLGRLRLTHIRQGCKTSRPGANSMQDRTWTGTGFLSGALIFWESGTSGITHFVLGLPSWRPFHQTFLLEPQASFLWTMD